MAVLTDALVGDYVETGFVQSIPVLTPAEVRYYRAAVEKTCAAMGGQVTRMDGLHYFFQWAWDLATHARLLDAMETLLGPNILLKATRIFYKHARSTSFVGWHQDGITERLEDAQVPAVWLGLTEATVENGCLRVVPRSHHLGLVPHADLPNPDNLTSYGTTAQVEVERFVSGGAAGSQPAEASRETGGLRARRSTGDELLSPFDVVMRAGEMSLHHPLVLHASNPNRTGEPRIGFSATYSATPLPDSLTAVAWVRGSGPAHPNEARPPRYASLEAAVAAHRAGGHQLLRGAM